MLVELEPGGVGVEVEDHPVVVTERQSAAHPRRAGSRGEHRPLDDDGGLARRQDLAGRRAGDARLHAHPRRSRERGLRSRPRRGRRAPRRSPAPARRSSAGVEPKEATLAWKSWSGTVGPGRRRRVRVRLPARRLLRLLGPFVVAPHRVRVGEQLQLRVGRQVLPRERVELPGHPRVGLRIVQQHLDRRWAVDDLRLVRRRRSGSRRRGRCSGSVSSGLGQRTDRRERVPQPLRGHLQRAPGSTLLVREHRARGPSRSSPASVRNIPPATGSPARPGRTAGAAVIAARCRSTAWSLIRLAGLERHVSVESTGCREPVDPGPGRQYGGPGGRVRRGDDAKRQRSTPREVLSVRRTTRQRGRPVRRGREVGERGRRPRACG